MGKINLKKFKSPIILIIILFTLAGIIIFLSLREAPSEISEKRIYCKPESRNAEACIEIYAPVCGFDSNENSVKTFSNSCFACMDENIKYYIQGKCQK